MNQKQYSVIILVHVHVPAAQCLVDVHVVMVLKLQQKVSHTS